MADRVSNRIIELTETASTNEDGLRLALAGEDLPLWVTARRQTSGRGRAGRSWVSLEGNLHGSFVMRTLAPLTCAGQLALVAGVALVDAVLAIAKPYAPDGIRLKWPNDLLIGRAKLGGILVETTPARQSPGFIAVIGFGLNIAACPPDLEAACLTQYGVNTDGAKALEALDDMLDCWLQIWDAGDGFADIREGWLARCGPLGESISVQGQHGPLTGTFEGLDAQGALLAGIDGRLQTITYGDVRLIAPMRTDGSR